MPANPNRLAFLDALKAVASQLIVLHHLAFYGPMSDAANGLAPELFEWLSQNARIAVQVFLVIGGFLAAKGLAPTGAISTEHPLAALRKRYFKLVLPYAAALLLSLVCAAIARKLMLHDSIPGKPHTLQLLAHLALLQGVLHFDSLSTGVWYIAIDFQLFAMLLCILWVVDGTGVSSNKTRLCGVLLVIVATLASLFHFNRLPSMDDWALYFFGAYGLGVLTYWITRSKHRVTWMAALTLTVLFALTINFRPRIAVALTTALAIWGMTISGHLATFPPRPRLCLSRQDFLLGVPLALSDSFAHQLTRSPLLARQSRHQRNRCAGGVAGQRGNRGGFFQSGRKAYRPIPGAGHPGHSSIPPTPLADRQIDSLKTARRTAPDQRRSHPATSSAKYVSTPSAPARLNPSKLSSTHAFSSSQPFWAAALSMANSPLTW